MPILIVVPRLNSKLGTFWSKILWKIIKICFPPHTPPTPPTPNKMCFPATKKTRQGCTTQNLRVRMHQPLHVKSNPLKNKQNPEINTKTAGKKNLYLLVCLLRRLLPAAGLWLDCEGGILAAFAEQTKTNEILGPTFAMFLMLKWKIPGKSPESLYINSDYQDSWMSGRMFIIPDFVN